MRTPILKQLRDYLDRYLLTNVMHYFKQLRQVQANADFLRACYLRCAELEADIAIARHWLSQYLSHPTEDVQVLVAGNQITDGA